MPLLDMLADRLKEWLTSTEVLHVVLGKLRDFDPIVTVGNTAVVTRHADVVEVLENGRDFGVTETYRARMERTTGLFILGLEDTPQYRSESAFVRGAVRADDMARLRGLVAREAEAVLEHAGIVRRLDAASEYAHALPLALVAEFFGVPGPDRRTLGHWMRTIFRDIFLNLGDDAEVRAAATQSGDQVRLYLRELIAARRAAIAAGSSAPDDFLTRLVRAQANVSPPIDDEGVRRCLSGVIVGAVDTTSKAIVLALEELLRRPDELARAQRAARDGDDRLVAAYAFEALRHNPHNPILVRTCHRDSVLAEGTQRETTIEKGTTVYVATLSAMFDDAVVEAPEEFRVNRPASNYLHFGRGQHTCFGERINQVTVPEALKRLLLLPNLRRAAEGDGEVVYDGPFPEHYFVEWGNNT